MAESAPHFICLAGPMLGQIIAIGEHPLLFGRVADCDVQLLDTAVSRKHCTVRRAEGGRIVFADLDSRNGSFVNGLPVRETDLVPGDEIRLGGSVFLFQRDSVTAINAAMNSERTLSPSSHLFSLSRAQREQDAARGRTVRELEALLAISTALQGHGTLEPVARCLLDSLQKALQAAACSVSLFFDGLGAPPWSLATNGDPPLFDAALLAEVVGAEKAVAGDGFLAAPVAGPAAPLGLLWAEGPDFDAAHLRLAAAAGAMAGLALQAARSAEEAAAETRRLRSQLAASHDMVGDSEPMQAIYRFVARIAPAPSTVLILGESGTGKELVAQAIHRNSPRAAQSFVAINCASLSDNLLESELFGHEKGAFTGAIAQKRGKLEIANGGTVFLDELGEMPVTTQAKLLRVLQQREMERLGGTRVIPLDIRVIAATNIDLSLAVKEHRFREDLYHRLNVVSIAMPPLRSRLTDVPLLAAYFVAAYSRQMGRRMAGVAPSAMSCLLRYDWPGNVRELQNAMERAVAMGFSEYVLPEDLPEALHERAAPPAEEPAGYHATLNAMKKQLIRDALAAAAGNVTVAAARLGLHPNYLHRLMSNLELR